MLPNILKEIIFYLNIVEHIENLDINIYNIRYFSLGQLAKIISFPLSNTKSLMLELGKK